MVLLTPRLIVIIITTASSVIVTSPTIVPLPALRAYFSQPRSMSHTVTQPAERSRQAQLALHAMRQTRPEAGALMAHSGLRERRTPTTATLPMVRSLAIARVRMSAAVLLVQSADLARVATSPSSNEVEHLALHGVSASPVRVAHGGETLVCYATRVFALVVPCCYDVVDQMAIDDDCDITAYLVEDQTEVILAQLRVGRV